jgi:D-hydroxyproline dehydrogenase subunit gamma
MFERMDKGQRDSLRFTFNGAEVTGQSGDTIAAALLAKGHRVFRQTPTTAAPRGPYCMMGSCFECLVVVDGETVQACQTAAQDGLTVTSPPAVKDIP